MLFYYVRHGEPIDDHDSLTHTGRSRRRFFNHPETHLICIDRGVRALRCVHNGLRRYRVS